MDYKVKRYERIRQVVDENGTVNHWESEDKMNVKEDGFSKVYHNNLYVSQAKYKDFFLLILLSKYMDERNVVHIDTSLRDVIQEKMGGATASAVFNGIKNLLDIGFIFKVVCRNTHKVSKGTYFLSPNIVSKNNSGLTQNLRSYLEYNQTILNDEKLIINPVIIGNKITLVEYSDIPKELLRNNG